MATSKDFCNYIIEQLSDLSEITLRPMMSEYLLYYKGVLVGGIYDERVLLKETANNAQYDLSQVTPYAGAKRTMYYVEDIDNREQLQKLILSTYDDLKNSQK